MEYSNIKTSISVVGNDLKTAIDDIMWIVSSIHEDIEKLKIKTVKPNKAQAQALLEYVTMENNKTKNNIKILCGDEMEKYFKWLDEYCKNYSIKREQVLNEIINEKL